MPEHRVSNWWQRHIYKNGNSGSASTRKKLWFSNEEKDILKLYFDEDYILGDRRYSIADELGVDVGRVVTWWANRKMFLKKNGVDIPSSPRTPLASRSKDSNDIRTAITDEHKSILNEYFSENPNPSFEKRMEIIEKTGLSSAQVYMWFYWKRKGRGIETIASPRKSPQKSPRIEKNDKWGFSHQQQVELTEIYEFNPNPSIEEREKLSEQLNMSKLKVYQWFYYKRKRDPNMTLDDSFGSADNKLVVDDRRENHKRITIEQMNQLEKSYCTENPTDCRLASKDERRKIADDLDLNERQVYQWYYRRVRGDPSATELASELSVRSPFLGRPKNWTTKKFRPLRKEYDENPTGGRIATTSGRKEIAEELGLSEQQVYTWYYNHATKDGHKIKDSRSKFKDWQRDILKNHFEIDQNPLGQDLKKLIARTRLRRRQVYHWFREERKRRENRETPELDVWQEEMLESFFETNEHPSLDERSKLADDTELNERKVNAWFKNRRDAQNMDISNEKSDISDDEEGVEDEGGVEDVELNSDEDADNNTDRVEIKVENVESDGELDIGSDSEEVESKEDQIEDWQKLILSAHWKKTQNPSGQLFDRIVKQTKLKKFQIDCWFRRQRISQRAETEESSEQSLKILTPEQKEILNDAFELTKYPCKGEKSKLLRKVFID